VTVAGNNGAAIPSSSYSIELLPNGHYGVVVLEHYNWPDESILEVHGNGGEFIDYVLIEVDGSGNGQPVVVRIKSDPPSGIVEVGDVAQSGSALTVVNLVQSQGDLGGGHCRRYRKY
jgi:hypothetical protein